ncbi:cell cycle checkpoint protein RAD17 [Uranotaenia lowii]|uniref:cell cycle checkpoint protein RAD17 n=1 Tax=Uranotaenia lowii TaxID=190385 RepID=UPI00247984E1|nr:cell cycle checkpoint protein RAD17 [Uranotaenia lowii]
MSHNKSKWFTSAFDAAPPARPAAPVLDSGQTSFQFQTSLEIVEEPPSKRPARTVSKSKSFAKPSAPAPSPRQVDWAIDFAPKSTADLAVHPKKLEELQHWFKTYEKMKASDPVAILLLSGPPGCGKCSAINAVAKDHGYQIAEWTTPVDVDLYSDDYDFESGTKEFTFRESQKAQFGEFLYKTSRYCSIFQDDIKPKLLLVKDLPNVFLRDPDSFHDSLEHYLNTGASPLVFIATETSSKKSDIVFNLFPATVLQDFQILHVTFNPVSTTLMKKALKRISTLMVGAGMAQHYRVPSQDVIESIVLSSQGDLRNATLNMHFASLKNAPRLETEQVPGTETLNTTGRGSRKKETIKLKSVGCNESLTLMHALGRVFNPKFHPINQDEGRFLRSPEDLTDAFVSQPNSIISLIHSNYVLRFTDIDDIVGAADNLSLADVIMSEYREDQLAAHGLNIVIRGMMVHNRKTAGGWQSIRKKKTYDRPSASNHESQLKRFGLETSSISAGLFITDYKKYLDIIQPVKTNS